jgi:hypothetical protein
MPSTIRTTSTYIYLLPASLSNDIADKTGKLKTDQSKQNKIKNEKIFLDRSDSYD